MIDRLKVELDISAVQRMARGLTPAQFTLAWRRTLRKVSHWAKGQVAKAVAADTRIPQKVLRQRVYFFLRSRDSGKVWLGLNPVEAARLGKVRQTRKGVTVGRHRFAGAWTMSKRDPDGKVYKRSGEARLPYAEVKMDWEQAGEAAFERIAEKIEDHLLHILRQEVNYEIQKVLGRAR